MIILILSLVILLLILMMGFMAVSHCRLLNACEDFSNACEDYFENLREAKNRKGDA